MQVLPIVQQSLLHQKLMQHYVVSQESRGIFVLPEFAISHFLLNSPDY